MEDLIRWRDSQLTAPEEWDWCTDGTLARYLEARKGDAKAAQHMLEKTREWRKHAVQAPLCCEVCDGRFDSHCFWSIGTCKDGSLAVYGNPPRASNPSVAETVKHVVHHLEHGFAELERLAQEAASAQAAQPHDHPGSPSQPAVAAARWTWLVDFNGFGFTHAMQARLGISFATTFADHYPERLAKLVLINPPGVFIMLLNAIHPFADQRTLSKIVTVNGSPEQVAKQLVELQVFDKAGDPVLDWLQRALAMEAKPGNLPPFLEEHQHLIPKGPGWKGWQ